MPLFISIRFLDILDVILVALLLYQLYRLIKGTVAFNILIGFFSLYLLWIVVKALNMQLLGSIMGQFIGVGVLALIVVFHPEIRKFLLFIGTNYNVNKVLSLDKLFGIQKEDSMDDLHIKIIADACFNMAQSKIGALIVIARDSELKEQIMTGEVLNAKISSSLLRTIFFTNTPLHDGAVIIKDNMIVAAGCILPLTQRKIDKIFGLRHRSAIGITENTDAVSVIVSEERGTVAFAAGGKIKQRLTHEALVQLLSTYLNRSSKQTSNNIKEDQN